MRSQLPDRDRVSIEQDREERGRLEATPWEPRKLNSQNDVYGRIDSVAADGSNGRVTSLTKNGRLHSACQAAVTNFKTGSCEWWFEGEKIAAFDAATQTFDRPMDMSIIKTTESISAMEPTKIISAASSAELDLHIAATRGQAVQAQAAALPELKSLSAWRDARGGVHPQPAFTGASPKM